MQSIQHFRAAVPSAYNLCIIESCSGLFFLKYQFFDKFGSHLVFEKCRENKMKKNSMVISGQLKNFFCGVWLFQFLEWYRFSLLTLHFSSSNQK